MPYEYKLFAFDALSTPLLYAILALRAEVFVVEQNSVYQDVDGMDPYATHICLFDGDRLIGYARLFAPNVKFEETSVGRIVVDKEYRGKGLGKDILQYGMELLKDSYPGVPVRIEAQHYLQKFYEAFGFVADSDVYIWDGIPHVKMVTQAAA